MFHKLTFNLKFVTVKTHEVVLFKFEDSVNVQAFVSVVYASGF